MINKINVTDKLSSIYLNKVELFELTIGSTLVELSIYKHMVLIKKCYMHNILKNHNYRAITGWFINKNSIKSKLRGKKGKKVCWAVLNLTIYGHRQMLFLFLAQYYANRGLSERSRSPEYQDIKIFEIGWKMTELWALTRCPNMGADTILALKSALKWANINIFQWDLFYMISRHKLHACGE